MNNLYTNNLVKNSMNMRFYIADLHFRLLILRQGQK